MEFRTQNLADDELKSLQKELQSAYLTAITIFLMAYILFHLLLYVKTEKWIFTDFEVFIFIGLATLISLLTRYFTQQLRNEIDEGCKTIEYKTIKDKYSYTDRKDGLSSEYTKYVIVADQQKFVVSEDLYNQARVTGVIIVHLTPIREITLKIEIKN